MNNGVWACGLLGIVFLLTGVLFAALKEKGAMLVSGFNTLPRAERQRYDRAAISRDMAKRCFLWAGILFAGALLSRLITPYMAIPALAVWLFLFFKDVRTDAKKAFARYLKPDGPGNTRT